MSGVVLINPKYPHNVAAAIRACSCFGISRLAWMGNRVRPSEYARLPREERMKGYKDVAWENSDYPLSKKFPDSTPVCIELIEGAQPLSEFKHPDNAVYVFGPEDGGVPQVYRRLCHSFVFIPALHCLNLAAALNVVLYDRAVKLWHILPWRPKDILKEDRGEIAQPGWEGQ